MCVCVSAIMDKRPNSGSSNSISSIINRHPSRNGVGRSATSILTELIKLKSQQKYLDASQITLNPQKSNSNEEMAQINDVENLKTELEINLAAFIDSMHNNTGYAMHQLREFQRTMMNSASIQQCQMKEYREKLLLLDRLLREMTEHNANEMNRLRQEFMATEGELAVLTEDPNFLRQHERSLSSSWRTLTVKRAVAAPIERADSDNVRQFDRFVVDAGGHCGGWAEEEHKLFVKTRLRFKNNIERICQELQPILIGACSFW